MRKLAFLMLKLSIQPSFTYWYHRWIFAHLSILVFGSALLLQSIIKPVPNLLPLASILRSFVFFFQNLIPHYEWLGNHIFVGWFLGSQVYLFHWIMCVFLHQYHTVFIAIALSYNLKSESMMVQALFFLKIALVI